MMRETILIATRPFRVLTCCLCAVEFAVPTVLDETCLRDKQIFWCPNGHDQHYITSIKETLDRVRQDLAEALASRDRAEAQVNRLKDRMRENLRRHMQIKHKVKNPQGA